MWISVHSRLLAHSLVVLVLTSLIELLLLRVGLIFGAASSISEGFGLLRTNVILALGGRVFAVPNQS